MQSYVNPKPVLLNTNYIQDKDKKLLKTPGKLWIKVGTIAHKQCGIQSQLRIPGKKNFGISKKVMLFTEVKMQKKYKDTVFSKMWVLKLETSYLWPPLVPCLDFHAQCPPAMLRVLQPPWTVGSLSKQVMSHTSILLA